MAYRVILVRVMGDPADKAALDVTRAVGQRMHAHIVGLHVRTPAATLMVASMFDAMPMPPEVIRMLEENSRNRAAAARDLFMAWQTDSGIESAASPIRTKGPTAQWVDVEAPLAGEIAGRAHTADLVVLARSTREYATASDDALHGALFNSGRPALIVPGAAATGPFETVVIAWNDSREAAHVAAAAWSLIGRARRIVVFVGDAHEDRRRAADRFVAHLAWRGYTPASVVSDASRDVGPALLEAAQREKAGLIVMGAYTHSRLRHLVFGGATSHVLAHATIPVLMAH